MNLDSRVKLENHVLQFLERTDFHHCGSRFCFESGFFTGEWVDAFASFNSWLTDGYDFEETWENEFANSVLFHVSFNDVAEAVENGSDLLAAEASGFCDLLEDLSLGVT